ncbi:MAG TPA: ABC transporter permease, partial [Clostridiaceae bacterium]|nr:ABC transporter permease [Clostridiaceae bacterium]
MTIKKSTGEKIFIVINYIFIGLCSFIALYPFIQIVATSFSSSRA